MTRYYTRARGEFRRVPAAPVRVREPGRTRLVIACAVCPEEFTATPAQFAGRGRRCPGCGTLHTDEGTFDPQDRAPQPRPLSTPES